MKLPDSLSKLLHSVALTTAALCMNSCDPILDNGYHDCDVTYHIRFKYDYNMMYVDAFPEHIRPEALYAVYAFNSDGTLAAHRSVYGQELIQNNCMMSVDFNPADYTLVAWGGVAEGETFSVPQNFQRIEQLACTMQRGNAVPTAELTPLYHSMEEHPELLIENGDELNPVVEMPMVKNTNTLRVVLQNLSEKALDVNDFTFSITEANGLMNYDNSLLQDEVLTYRPFYTGQGDVDYQASTSSRNSDQLNVVIAEFTFGRLMADRKPLLTIVNNRTGNTVLSLPLTDYLKLVKSHYNRQMTDQEYFDRQDEYSLTFFLDENNDWYSAVILINSWRVVLSDVDL